MSALIEVESTLTSRYQTTVPETVRRTLKLDKHDKIHYTIRSDGQVVLTRAAIEQNDDPVVGAFLDFLEQDMAQDAKQLQPLNTALASKIQRLVDDVEVDLDTPLQDDDE